MQTYPSRHDLMTDRIQSSIHADSVSAPLASEPHTPAGQTPKGDHSITRQSAFTLVELLAVLAIIALITIMALIGFTRTSRGRAFQKAVSDVHTALSLARQQAIAKSTPVMFLVCDENFAARNPGIKTNFIRQSRTYAIFDPKARRYLQGWTELPQGVVFIASPSTEQQDILDNIGSPPTCVFTNIPYPSPEYASWASDYSNSHALGVAFLSDGSLFFRATETNPKWRRLAVAEGVSAQKLIPNGQINAILIALSGVASVEEP